MITPPPFWVKKKFITNFFLDLSAIFRVCNGYFSQTQSLPKLNTLDLQLKLIHQLQPIKETETTTIDEDEPEENNKVKWTVWRKIENKNNKNKNHK